LLIANIYIFPPFFTARDKIACEKAFIK